MGALPDTECRRRIILMRHGHVDYLGNLDKHHPNDVPLTSRGVGEAQASGRALKDMVFDRAICSGYPRTRQTAEHVLSQLETAVPELEVEPRFVEISVGDLTQGHLLTSHSIAEMEREAFAQADKGGAFGEGGELFDDVLARMVEGFEALLADKDWTTALVVAHEGVNRVLLSYLLVGSMAAVAPLQQDLACINVIDVDEPAGGSPVIFVKSVNITPDNPTKHGMNRTSLEEIFQPYEDEA